MVPYVLCFFVSGEVNRKLLARNTTVQL